MQRAAVFFFVLAVAMARNVYLGTYQSAPGGVMHLLQDEKTGEVTLKDVYPAIQPSALALDPHNSSRLYDLSESKGTVGSWSKGSDGHLTRINIVKSGGDGPCHISTHSSGKWIFAANYDSGHFASFPVDATGKLGQANIVKPGKGSPSGKDNQEGPHAHMIVEAPNGLIAGVDLGSDAVFFWKLSSNGKLKLSKTWHAEVGTGPRHIVFHSKLQLAFVMSENANNIHSFNYNGTELKTKQVISTLPSDYKGASHGAELRIHPNGGFLYATNRGHNSIAVFQIDQTNGHLTLLDITSSHGDFPRGMNLDPSAKFLYVAGQNDDTFSTFTVQEDGKIQYQKTVKMEKVVDIAF